MFAIVTVFYSDIIKMLKSLNFYDKNPESSIYRRFAFLVLVGSIPAGLAGFFFEKNIQAMFESTLFVGFALLFTAVLLLLSKRLYGEKTLEGLSVRDAVIIGIGQAFAIIPGISRSGSTIVAALFRKVEPQTAARFSLILSIPAVLGANILALRNTPLANLDIPFLAVGSVVSFLTGILAIKLLLKVLASKRLELFAGWCIVVGLITIALETF